MTFKQKGVCCEGRSSANPRGAQHPGRAPRNANAWGAGSVHSGDGKALLERVGAFSSLGKQEMVGRGLLAPRPPGWSSKMVGGQLEPKAPTIHPTISPGFHSRSPILTVSYTEAKWPPIRPAGSPSCCAGRGAGSEVGKGHLLTR